ncbi:hypothetical protein Q3G72_019634 [Acer saccharum]|nr:hypothetical protein Q3G72_019634 [Acer saccharum]
MDVTVSQFAGVLSTTFEVCMHLQLLCSSGSGMTIQVQAILVPTSMSSSSSSDYDRDSDSDAAGCLFQGAVKMVEMRAVAEAGREGGFPKKVKNFI